jgi:outer membrane protein
MKSKMKQIIILILLLLTTYANAQTKIQLSLDEAVLLAQSKSLAAFQVQNDWKNKHWAWKSFQSNYRPQLKLTGEFPNYLNSYQAVLQNDGSTQYVKVNYNYADINLALAQPLAFTGGQFYVSSSVERFDNFSPKNVNYSTNPFVIGFTQPILKYNKLKWDKKIEPLKYEEAQKDLVEKRERIAYTTSQYFFDVLTARKEIELATQNMAYSDTLIRIAQGKNEMGKNSQSDLLQLKLAKLNAQKSFTRAKVNLEIAMLNLKTYMGVNQNDELRLSIPVDIIEMEIDAKTALANAHQNRAKAVSFIRQRLEAESLVAEAKRQGSFNADLSLELGYSNSNPELRAAYQNSIDRKMVNLRFTMPILDWGRSNARKQTALANQELTEYQVKQEEINFEKEILLNISQFKMAVEQVKITAEAEKIAGERYQISIERYKLGNIDITGLMRALDEKDLAKNDYIHSLNLYWQNYFLIRTLTLYDFKLNKTINN